MSGKETKISKSIGEFLTLNRVPNWRCGVLKGQFRKHGTKNWYHIDTGIKGLSDRQFMTSNGSGQTVYLEIKQPGKNQSDIQKEFEENCVKRNIPYFVARSVDDAAEILEALGMLRVKYYG